ncbi:hypothetical protein JCM14713_01610 [Desulfomicrobium salsuginis]
MCQDMRTSNYPIVFVTVVCRLCGMFCPVRKLDFPDDPTRAGMVAAGHVSLYVRLTGLASGFVPERSTSVRIT